MLVEVSKLPTVRNCILGNLPQSDFASIRPFLHSVFLKERTVLQEPARRIEYINFIETGIVSLRTLATGNVLETATVGSQGAVGVAVALGAQISMHQSIVLIPGRALRICVNDLYRSMLERPRIREHLLRYVEALMIQGSQTAFCCAHHDLEKRLARWLSLVCDALGGDVLPITHDHLSTILGVRRAGVTETLARFEELGLIRKMRGVLHVRDRTVLKQRACCCYGIIAKAYYSARTLRSDDEAN